MNTKSKIVVLLEQSSDFKLLSELLEKNYEIIKPEKFPSDSLKYDSAKGDSISLSQFKGNYILVDFWSTTCGPCLPEIPRLKLLWDRYGDDNFKIVSISLDRKFDALALFVDEQEMTWPQISQIEKWQGEIVRLYNVNAIPKTYLLNSSGEIIEKDLRGDEMIQVIDDIMSNQ